MEIVFLGTSAAVPTKNRNLSSVILLYEGTQLLFDAGEDIQRQFEAASIKFNKPLTIFISHMHGDHVIGLPGLLFHFTLINRSTEVEIYGPPGIFSYLMIHRLTTGLNPDFLKTIYEFEFDTRNLKKFNFHGEINQNPEEVTISNGWIYETEEYKVQMKEVCHSVPTMGFRFVEKPRPGKFYPEIAEKYGIPRKKWKYMQLGKKLEHKGKIIDPEKEGIVGPKRDGLIISYSADTKPCDNLNILIKNSDVAICEATFSEELVDLAKEKKHSTAYQSAEIAKNNGVKLLILTHISSRYADRSDEIKLLDEATSVFSNTLIAYDLMRIIPNKNT